MSRAVGCDMCVTDREVRAMVADGPEDLSHRVDTHADLMIRSSLGFHLSKEAVANRIISTKFRLVTSQQTEHSSGDMSGAHARGGRRHVQARWRRLVYRRENSMSEKSEKLSLDMRRAVNQGRAMQEGIQRPALALVCISKVGSVTWSLVRSRGVCLLAVKLSACGE